MAADDDHEVFEITDFTTASEWERFISRVEEILHEWKLVSCSPKFPAKKDAYTNGVWEERTEDLNFADFKFTLSHVWLQCKDGRNEKSAEKESGEEEGDEDNEQEETPTVYGDLINMDNDFPSRAHCICRWYGLQDFVILYPASNVEAILSESKTKLLLSSVNVALSDAGCAVPIFVQVQQKWRRLYQGTCVLPGSAIEFSMIHLKYVPTQYSHLAGLLDVFKSKMGTINDPRPPVSVAVRFLYCLYDWVNSPWSQPLPDFDSEVGCQGFDQLPFGACEDPVSALNLYCTWPSLSEDMIVENQVYSDLDPLQAPQWSVRIQMTEDPQCLMGEYLINFLALCHRRETLEQLIGNLGSEGTENEVSGDISNALQRLTEPSMSYNMPSLSSYVPHTHKTKPKVKDAAIQGDLFDQVIQYLFPDAAKPMSTDDNTDTASGSQTAGKAPSQLPKELSKQLKCSPVGGLLHRLSVCLCVLNHNHGGLFAVAQIWQEFVLEMRYRWDNNYYIDGVEKGPPNLGSCILQQKLQMLNCCIEHKKKREQLHKGYTGEIDSPPDSPYHGPSTSQVARTLSHEGGVTDQDNQSDITNTDQSGAQGEEPANLNRSINSDNSSDEEFFECDQSDDEAHSGEKEVDTATENQSDVEEQEVTTGNQSESEMDCDNGNNSVTGSQTQENNSMTGSQTQENNFMTGSQTQENNSMTASKTQENNTMTASQIRDMTGSQTRDSTSRMSIQSESNYKETFSYKPEGRLAPFQELHLVNCDEKMYIPITQEPAPMTEDMLEEHAEILAKLGTSAEGAELRARMQSACLLSDMESFKAANPGCVLEDFVRWYSPRDWVEETVEGEDGEVKCQGHLSLRMQIPGNMWVEVWQTSRPVPARRQKRLFDDTKEAEKVLHFLSSLRPADVVVHLLPMLIHAALLKAIENDNPNIPVLKQVIEQACQKASLVTRSPQQDAKRYEEVMRMLLQAEIMIARNISLQSKFTEDLLERRDASGELDHFVTSILQNSEVCVRGGPMGPAGSVISKLFQAAQRNAYMVLYDEDQTLPNEDDAKHNTTSVPNFPRPTGREYILRTIVPRPAPYSKQLPQRMFCAIEEDEFRITGAFASDTVFQ